MPGRGVVLQRRDSATVDEFLTGIEAGSAALLIEGEPGIGKTTLWSAAVDRARERGFLVLSARPGAAESVLAYASVADLLADVDPAVWAGLPEPQRLAIDRAMLRAETSRAETSVVATDQHAVAAGFLSLLKGLVSQTKVLIAIDDAQWLDQSSQRVIAFVARRLPAGAGLLVASRDDPESARATPWLQLPNRDALHRIRIGPQTLGALHTILSERLGRSFSRPAMVRIEEVSGGNPFYALELGRAMDAAPAGGQTPLPGTLAELVHVRIGGLDPDLQGVLLASACAAAPTVDLVVAATRLDLDRVTSLIEDAEDNGIIGLDGNRLQFSHPLLARGVYDDATAARRRRMHQRLAEIVDEPELRARHLALAAVSGDPSTLEALDTAAELARSRGAPAAAAELVTLAIGLGGDTPRRRIHCAGHHFNAGDLGWARSLLQDTIDRLEPGHPLRAEALSQLAAVCLYDDSFAEGAAVVARALAEVGDNQILRAQLVVMLAQSQLNTGDLAGAIANLDDAVAGATGLNQPQLLSQALGIRVVAGFIRGDGFDETSMRRAVAMEVASQHMPVALRPSMQNALLLACVGRLEQARQELVTIRRGCLERGDEAELMFAAFYSVLTEIWRGNFAEAAVESEETMERAVQMGSDHALFVSLTIRATLAAYAGRVDEARRDTGEAMAAGMRSGSSTLLAKTIANLGFLELSLGDYQAAQATFAPLLAALAATPNGTEILLASFIPDAAEALIQLGRFDEAEPLIAKLESNGERLGRTWMMAVGARCRAMLLAARGDLDGAAIAAQRAMAEHDRLPMPFERARTQILHGQLQRRQRRKDAATTTLHEALRAFEAMDTPLWADRARAELARTNVSPSDSNGSGLTPSEQRVAELAASGMTNRDVATALFISPKTVEVNLSRVYRKLGIHSRAELGSRMGRTHDE